MADRAPKNAAAAQNRIISHLNGDHQESLSLYLRHYNKLPASAVSKPLVTDITFDALTIQSADGKPHTVPFKPPMKSWAEARERTVEMDREARAALDISTIKITEYEPPKSFLQLTIFGLCIFTWAIFLTRTRIVEGTWFHDKVLPWFPGGPAWFLWIVNLIVLPVLVIHASEATWLDMSRLRKHGVERGTALWYKWIVSCFIEGRGCFQRIDATVKRKALKSENAKH